MNNRILFGGTIIISILFIGFFYYFVSQRQQQLYSEFPATQSTSELIELTNKAEFEKADQIGEKEAYSLDFLLRGTVLSYTDNQMSVLAQVQNENGTNSEKIIQVNTPANEKVLCWPETRSTGNTKIQIKDAYFQLEPGQELFLNKQTETTLKEISNTLETRYIFALVSQSVRDIENDIFNAQQLAILGC